MSAISLKSISGITSITTPAGVDDQLTLHNNNTTERVKIDVAGNVHVNNHLAVAGVTTFSGNIELTGSIGSDVARLKIPDGMNGGPFTGNLELGNNRDFVMLHDGHHNYVKANNGNIYVTCGGNTLTTLQTNGTVLLNKDLDVDGHTNLDNVSIVGVTTFSHTGANQLVIKDSDTSGDAAHMRISFQDSGGTEKFFVGNNNSNGWLYLGSPSGQNNNTVVRVNGQDKIQVNANGLYVGGYIEILDTILHSGDTDTKIRFPANDTITFETAGNEAFRIDSGRRLLGGVTTNTPVCSVAGANLQVHNNASVITASFTAYGAHAGGSVIALGKSRSNTVGDATAAVSNGDTLGDIRFGGSDGTDMHNTAAAIRGEVDGSVSSNSIPGRLEFSTNSGSANVERLRITSDGKLVTNSASSIDCGVGGMHLYLGAGARNDYSTAADGLIIEKNGSTGLSIDPGSSGTAAIYFPNESNHSIASITHNNSTGELRVRGEDHIILATNANTERLRIKSDGELVINHTQASTPLNNTFLSIYDANSDSSAIDASGISKNYAMISLHNYGTGVPGDSTGIGFGAGASFGYTKGSIAFARSGSYGTGDLIFLTNNDQDATMVNDTDEKMRITRDDKVKITGVVETGPKTITGGTNLAIQNFVVKGVWSGSPSIGKEIELISGYDGSVKMAAIGYNLTDTNTGSTYGGDLVFHTQPLYSSPQTPIPESMRISSSGYVTKPKQPSFHIGSPYDSGQSSGQVWRSHSNAIFSNVGSHYNNSNGRFTAPVDGQYFFFHWGMSNSSGQTNDVYSRKNGSRDQIGTSYNQSSGAGHNQYSCSYVRTLSAGDYVDLYVSNGNNYATTDGRHGGWGGWLIG